MIKRMIKLRRKYKQINKEIKIGSNTAKYIDSCIGII